VERDALSRKIASIDSRSRQIANSLLIAALSVIIASLAMMLRRSHLQNAKKIKELRMSISSDLHDEVGSNLATISLLADLPQGVGEGGTLKEVKRLATETSLSLREIVDLTLADRARRALVDRMRDIASLMLCDHEWHLDVSDLPELGHLHRRDLIFYFKEALHNIIQHASAHVVIIRMFVREKRMILEIQDDGCGFDYDCARSLLTLHQRTTSLGGILQVETGPEKGTCLRLDFPFTSQTP
jgi:signal transduction histidine kinase